MTFLALDVGNTRLKWARYDQAHPGAAAGAGDGVGGGAGGEAGVAGVRGRDDRDAVPLDHRRRRRGQRRRRPVPRHGPTIWRRDALGHSAPISTGCCPHQVLKKS